MPVIGHSIIAGKPVVGTGPALYGSSTADGGALEPGFTTLSVAQLQEATQAAAQAFGPYRSTDPEQRATFLERIADEIEALGDELLERAHAESALPMARLTGERGRTCGQLRLFASVVRQGDHLGVRIDPALPERTPLPRPDLRQLQLPIGPVAVFGASNFPLAFSTAGGDTASALAAGCPVVVKAHPAHPGTADLVAQAITRAAEATGMPAGVFSLVHGAGNDIGQALVTDPHITAVGFTGSRGGGLALVAAAASRPVPIPVYAEMSSVNPVVILPAALDDGADSLASGYVASLTNGSGQFCTNPGLLFVPTGTAGDDFLASVGQLVGRAQGQPMLTAGIHEAYGLGTRRLDDHPATDSVATGTPGPGAHAPAPAVFAVALDAFDTDEQLHDEVFGAVGLVVRYESPTDLSASLSRLEGQLTVTLHGRPADHDAARLLLPVLEQKAGRILWGGWPTGVEVSPAMVHGGPFPATSDSRSTSVGTLAIERFQRPVCYQDLPAELLPEAVQDDNPWELLRRIDGTLTLPR